MNKTYITISNIIVELISVIMMIVCFIVAGIKAIYYKGMVPTHFDIYGNPDGYGSASSLMVLPGILLVVIVFVLLFTRLVPAKMINLPFRVNPGREVLVYHYAIMGVDLFALEMGIFILALTILLPSGKYTTPLAIALVISTMVSEAVCMLIAYIKNKM